jgi:hypothetical protein
MFVPTPLEFLTRFAAYAAEHGLKAALLCLAVVAAAGLLCREGR